VPGRGIFMQTCCSRPETGKMIPATTYAHACTIVVESTRNRRGRGAGAEALQVGKALNPKMVEQRSSAAPG
jgi:hypothetical protein